MIRRGASAAVGVIALSTATPAFAQSASIDVRAAPLPRALQSLARQTGAELLYDAALVRNRNAPAVRGTFTPEAAMRQLVSGSNRHAWHAARLSPSLPDGPDSAQTGSFEHHPDLDEADLNTAAKRSSSASAARPPRLPAASEDAV